MISQRHLRQEARRSLPAAIRERNQQVLEHLGLAHCAASRQNRRGPEEFDDLLQESRVGLIRGLDQFDPTRGLRPSSYLLSRANGQILHYRRDRSRTIRIPWRLRDLHAAGRKIQRDREQKQQHALSDYELAEALSVRPERWAAAVQSHGASQLLELSSSPMELISASEDDENLTWLKCVLHQVEGMPKRVLQAHLIEGQSIKELAHTFHCSRSTLRKHLNEGIKILQQWAQRDGLMEAKIS